MVLSLVDLWCCGCSGSSWCWLAVGCCYY
jgi:hypothetical protein